MGRRSSRRSSLASKRSCSAGCSRRRRKNTARSSRSSSKGTSSLGRHDHSGGGMRHPYADFLGKVEKPSRYVGGEYQEVRKPPGSVTARVCLVFPDVYEIG